MDYLIQGAANFAVLVTITVGLMQIVDSFRKP